MREHGLRIAGSRRDDQCASVPCPQYLREGERWPGGSKAIRPLVQCLPCPCRVPHDDLMNYMALPGAPQADSRTATLQVK